MTRSSFRSALATNLLLGFGSVLFALLIVLVLEGGLRLAGIGAPDASQASRLKYQQVYLPLLEPALRPDGTPILRTADRRLPYQSILQNKPANALTIVTFGGSATAGLGFSPNATFASQLERMLRRAHPDRIIQVLNLGIVALSSKQVKVLAADVCRRYDPDLIIVYSGNNEFLEIHAEKYAAVHANWLTRLGDPLTRTHLYRSARRAFGGAPRTPSLADQEFSPEDLRLTQRAIVRDIEMTRPEVEEVIRGYRKNLEEIVDAAAASGTPLILMTVASNWEWRGREDLPEDWREELGGAESATDSPTSLRLFDRIERELAASPPAERHEWLYRRALVAESVGNFELARASYRAAMNEDPHLRRALDAMNDEVRAAAQRSGVTLVDTVARLEQRAKHRIVGFDEFYDYVHFTPGGAAIVAAELFRTIGRMGIVPPGDDSDAGGYLREPFHPPDALDADAFAVDQQDAFAVDQQNAFAVDQQNAFALDQQDAFAVDQQNAFAVDQPDAFAVDQWLGFGFDPTQIADRDLWKYDRLLAELDHRIEANPADLSALVYRGNANFFRADGAAAAERDYRAAIELAPANPILRANLERLLSERAP